MTALLELINITKRFPGVLANDQINLDLQHGEVHTLLGENGAGKTTLMNILFGLVQPNNGEIRIRGKKVTIHSPKEAIEYGIGMVHQHFMLVPNLTVTENIILGQELMRGPFLDKKKSIHIIEKLSKKYRLEVSPRRKVWQLSVGEQQRIEILKMLYRGADILVLDEPTASLTPQEIESLFEILQSLTAAGKSIIFISHKLEEVMKISTRISVLRRGKVIGTVNRQETTDKDLASMMIGREVMLKVSGEHRSIPKENPIASLRKINVIGDHGTNILENFDLDLFPGEILGVAGVDGNGQTELAELIAGLRDQANGEIIIDGNLQSSATPFQRMKTGIYYIPAERKKRAAAMSLPIPMNAILKNHRDHPISKNGILNHKAINEFTHKLIKEYDVRMASFDSPTETLSGGNLQKLILSREISGNPRILIAEQPTRGLDIGAIEFVRHIILKQRDLGCAIMLISADLEEILALSDRIVVMFKGKIIFEKENKDIKIDDIGMAMGGVNILH